MLQDIAQSVMAVAVDLDGNGVPDVSKFDLIETVKTYSLHCILTLRNQLSWHMVILRLKSK